MTLPDAASRLWRTDLRGLPQDGRPGGLLRRSLCLAIPNAAARTQRKEPSQRCESQPMLATFTGLPFRRVARVQVGRSKRLLAARHPSLHLPHLTAGPIENHPPKARKRPTRQHPDNAYAESVRPRGRLRRAPQISSLSRALAALKPRQRSSSPGSGGWRATLMRPRESEGSGRRPQRR